MSTALIDLGNRVLLRIAHFVHQSKRAAAPSGEDLSRELLQLFRELDQQARVDSGLADAWAAARRPLVFLIDEIMINTEWEYRGWWRDNSLERQLLGNAQMMRGILFYDELEKAEQALAEAQSGGGAAAQHRIDLVTIFYCALRFGFQGKFSGQPGEVQRIAAQALERLPAQIRESSRELFEQAYRHTVEVPPTYATYMRLATLLGLVAAMALLLIGFREYLAHDLLDDLHRAAEQAGDFFDSKA